MSDDFDAPLDEQIPELEVNVVRLEFHRAQSSKRQAARRIRLAQTSLASLLGLDPREPLAVRGAFEIKNRPETDTLALIQRALASRGRGATPAGHALAPRPRTREPTRSPCPAPPRPAPARRL